MKKLFFASLFLIVFLVFTTSFSFAAEKNSQFTYEEIVKDSNLPYPGILPDSRLYFLKMARDKIVGMLVSDSLKKVDFDILSADKRLSAGVYLFTSGEKKYALAISTISKGENYFVDAVSEIKKAKQQGVGVSETRGRLTDSLEKHQKILKRLDMKLSENVRKSIQQEEKKIEQLQKTVSSKELL